MALFKILRGESSAFTTDLQSINIYPEFHDGYCYFIADTGLFYIDYDDGSETRLVPFSGEDVGYLLTEGKAYYLRRDDGTYIRYTGDYNLLVEYDSPDSMPYFYYKTDGKHRIPLNTAQALAVKEINKGLDQKFWRGTKEEYKALDIKDEDTMYIVIDEEGGSIKADWNQNDESAPDYIKNRTHWVESEAHWTPLDSTDITFVGETISVSGMNSISQFSGMYQLSNCNKYRVTVNGAEYIAEAYYETNNGYYMLYPGSLSICLSESEVCMHRTDSKISSDMSIKIEAYMDAVYHPLDIKFLPNTVATKADIEAAIGIAIGGSY